ncbi:MAG: histidine phosphatase family protein, partial [Sphingomonas sp.]
MKTLTLLRHAKSGWDDPVARDFDRPLNAKGK